MAKVPPKHSRDQAQVFEGLLNNLQDWELAFRDKDKKLRSDATGNGNKDHPVQTTRRDSSNGAASSTQINGKQTARGSPISGSRDPVKKFDYKDYDALSRLSTGVLSEESSFDANSEKELGNEYFKQKKYNEAIDCYSRSIALSPTAVAYANRAMAFLKIKRFREAEEDCSEALNLDDRYIKAYSRRSTARKELGKLKECVDDAEFALRLEPQNQEIKKQLTEAKSLLQKELLKKASGVLAASAEGFQKPVKKVGHKPVKKVGSEKSTTQERQSLSTNSPVTRVTEILEDFPKGKNTRREIPAGISAETVKNDMIDDRDGDSGSETPKRKQKIGNQELRESVQELAAKAAKLAKAEAAKNILPPKSAYQFEVSWRGLSGDRDLQARLLKVMSPAALPAIFKNALSAPLLVDIIKCIATFFREDTALGVQYLHNLTKVPRFEMLIMCLSSADKEELGKAWNQVFSKGTMEYSEILGRLRSKYGIKQ